MTMYMRKPYAVEAVQWDGTAAGAVKVVEALRNSGHAFVVSYWTGVSGKPEVTLEYRQNTGVRNAEVFKVREGDYVWVDEVEMFPQVRMHSANPALFHERFAEGRPNV